MLSYFIRPGAIFQAENCGFLVSCPDIHMHLFLASRIFMLGQSSLPCFGQPIFALKVSGAEASFGLVRSTT